MIIKTTDIKLMSKIALFSMTIAIPRLLRSWHCPSCPVPQKLKIKAYKWNE